MAGELASEVTRDFTGWPSPRTFQDQDAAADGFWEKKFDVQEYKTRLGTLPTMSFNASGMPSDTISIPNGREANGAPHPKSRSRSSSSGALTPPVSVSPILSSNLHSHLRQNLTHHQTAAAQSNDNLLRQRVLRPFATGELRLLLLENISQGAVKAFQQLGFQVDHHTKAWSEEELIQKIGQYHAIGIRSKTRLTANVLKSATKVSPTQFSPRFRCITARSLGFLDHFLRALAIRVNDWKPTSRSSSSAVTR